MIINWDDSERIGAIGFAVGGYIRAETYWRLDGYHYRLTGAKIKVSKQGFASIQEAKDAAESALQKVIKETL